MDKTTDFGSIDRRNPLKLIDESTDKKVVSLDDWKEMRELADASRIAIEQTASDAILKNSKLLRGFNWKYFAFVLTAVAFNTLILTMYINDEMPWETHQHAIQERLAGQTLFKAWPTLPDETKQHILGYSKKYQRA